VRAGRYRWICYENEYSVLSLGWSPEAYPQLLDELQSNCCRGGHVARMFDVLMEKGDPLSWEPLFQDATPARNARVWLALFGGTWRRAPVVDHDYAYPTFTIAPEGR
jgi:hypothetical protein